MAQHYSNPKRANDAPRCRVCGHRAGAKCTDCRDFKTHGRIIEGLCAPCRGGGLRMFGTVTVLANQGPWKRRKLSRYNAEVESADGDPDNDNNSNGSDEQEG